MKDMPLQSMLWEKKAGEATSEKKGRFDSGTLGKWAFLFIVRQGRSSVYCALCKDNLTVRCRRGR